MIFKIILRFFNSKILQIRELFPKFCGFFQLCKKTIQKNCELFSFFANIFFKIMNFFFKLCDLFSIFENFLMFCIVFKIVIFFKFVIFLSIFQHFDFYFHIYDFLFSMDNGRVVVGQQVNWKKTQVNCRWAGPGGGGGGVHERHIREPAIQVLCRLRELYLASREMVASLA